MSRDFRKPIKSLAGRDNLHVARLQSADNWQLTTASLRLLRLLLLLFLSPKNLIEDIAQRIGLGLLLILIFSLLRLSGFLP